MQSVKSFPKMIREDIGFQLECLQQDQHPTQWQWLPSIGANVKAILLANEITYYLIYYETQIADQEAAHRVRYIKKYPQNIIYILHAFADQDELKPHTGFGIAKKVLSSVL